MLAITELLNVAENHISSSYSKVPSFDFAWLLASSAPSAAPGSGREAVADRSPQYGLSKATTNNLNNNYLASDGSLTGDSTNSGATRTEAFATRKDGSSAGQRQGGRGGQVAPGDGLLGIGQRRLVRGTGRRRVLDFVGRP